jgi:hypothetical protein
VHIIKRHSASSHISLSIQVNRRLIGHHCRPFLFRDCLPTVVATLNRRSHCPGFHDARLSFSSSAPTAALSLSIIKATSGRGRCGGMHSISFHPAVLLDVLFFTLICLPSSCSIRLLSPLLHYGSWIAGRSLFTLHALNSFEVYCEPSLTVSCLWGYLVGVHME